MLLYVFASLAMAQLFLSTAAAHAANICMISPNSLVYPNSTCQSVFRLPGAPPSRLHYFADGTHAWVAAKYAYLPDVDAAEYFGGSAAALPNNNYHVSRALLVAIAAISSDIVMAEAQSFVYANMASGALHLTVRNNILNDCAWFSNTHGSSTLDTWMSPMAPGFNIPDAQQKAISSCQGLYGASACGEGGSKYVLDSCGNNVGSKLHVARLFRMRCSSISATCDNDVNSTHSIWFRIPMSYRQVCEDSTGQLISTSPSSAPMLSFTSVTLYGNSFSISAKYFCMFRNVSLILATYVSSTALLCHIADDFVAPDFAMPIGLEQEICSGGTCSLCPIMIGDGSSQRFSATNLMFHFVPSLLKPAAGVSATVGSKLSLSIVGGYLDPVNNIPVFSNTTIVLADFEGFNTSVPSTYVPGSWPVGALEFVVPEWPNESGLVCITTIANSDFYSSVHAIVPYCIAFASSWKSAFPLEVSAISNQINITGSRFFRRYTYSCVLTPLFDGTAIPSPNVAVDAAYISINTLRCMFVAYAGRYRLNVYENGTPIFKVGQSSDVIFVENVVSIAPSQIFASASDFSFTVSGTGFDHDAWITNYACKITFRDQEMQTSKSAIVVKPSSHASSTTSAVQTIVVCTFSPWMYSSGTFELQLVNQRFNRILSGSTLQFGILPVWTSIYPSSGFNVLSTVITVSGYGLPVSLRVEAVFRSAQDVSQSSKSLSVIPESPFRVILETPNWYYTSFITVVELTLASSSISVSFSGNSRTFAFATVPPTLKFSPSVFDCSSPVTLTVHDTQRSMTNGSGYQCQLVNNATQVIVPAIFVAETNAQCRFGSWLSESIPSTLQLLYFGSIAAISRSIPICQHKLSRILPTMILSGSRSQITVFGSYIDVRLKYACVVGGLKSAAVYPNSSSAEVVCTVDAPQTSSALSSSVKLVTNDVESNSALLMIQTAWKSLHPSVFCLNSGSLLTVTGSFFSQHNKHELVFDYQTVAMAEYLKGTYVKPFPLSRSSIVSPAIEVNGSTVVVFSVPFSELSNAIDIHVSMRINDTLVPVDRSPDLRQFSLPFFTSATCAMLLPNAYDTLPACQTHPFQSVGGFPMGVSCISANDGLFRLSLSGGLFARSPNFQGQNWLSDPASSFICEVSSVSGFRSSVTGTVILANYSDNSESNFVYEVIIECGMTVSPSVALSTNGFFRYTSIRNSFELTFTDHFAVWLSGTKHFLILCAVDRNYHV